MTTCTVCSIAVLTSFPLYINRSFYFNFVCAEDVVVRVSDEGFCPSELVLHKGQVSRSLTYVLAYKPYIYIYICTLQLKSQHRLHLGSSRATE